MQSGARIPPDTGEDGAGMTRERLQKILASAGVTSRRKAEQLIRAGRVRVDGQVVTTMGFKIDPRHCRITVDGKPMRVDPPVYILLNKPAGYVTTRHDPQGRPTVMDLVADIRERVYPVGRLDLDSEGALLLTNDGRLTNRILHPRYQVNKTYAVIVRGRPSSRALRRLERGIRLEGRITSPARIRVVQEEARQTRVEIVIHEGRKRQVRKMFEAIGYPVLRLRRIAYGNLTLGALKPGTYRFLTKKDVKKIFSGKIPFTIKHIAD